MSIPNVLTIAGSDSGGGAGIQADLKAISARGAFGCSVLTALTAQNTTGVTAIHAVPTPFIREQMDAVFDDIDISAVKVGMLATAEIITAVKAGLRAHGVDTIVVDPVMVAKGGDRLLEERAVSALRGELLPEATLITPNLPEAGDLLERPEPASRKDMLAAGRALLNLGPKWVLVKGGHLSGDQAPDLLVGPGEPQWLEGPRHVTRNTHGTGCTLSSALAAELAKGSNVPAAVRVAKNYVAQAIAHADELSVGRGHGPVHHFYALTAQKETP